MAILGGFLQVQTVELGSANLVGFQGEGLEEKKDFLTN
jgi:hypothetical protein